MKDMLNSINFILHPSYFILELRPPLRSGFRHFRTCAGRPFRWITFPNPRKTPLGVGLKNRRARSPSRLGARELFVREGESIHVHKSDF